MAPFLTALLVVLTICELSCNDVRCAGESRPKIWTLRWFSTNLSTSTSERKEAENLHTQEHRTHSEFSGRGEHGSARGVRGVWQELLWALEAGRGGAG